jgi:hypothetical protein
MAQGVGQGAWQFASPDFPQGVVDYAGVAGDGQQSPFVTGPAVGGDASTTSGAEGAGAVHVSTGANPTGNPGARMNHWSNLLDWRNGPMFWLALGTILYFGLISLHVGAKAGHFQLGGGTGR